MREITIEWEGTERKMKIEDIIKLSDDKLYDYLDFEHNVHNWNDFLQPKFPNRTLNEIKTIDVDVNQRTSFFKGREFSVGVVEGKALPVIEIAPKEGWYDYKNKYVPGATIETCPAQITEEQTLRMQRHAEEAMKALGITSYGRVDFLMNEQGQMIVLEANTLPGMTATSLLPQEAAEVGVSYAELCEKLIEVSLKKCKA